jgi:hypothetical protein
VQVQPSETEVIQHWEKIISAVRGSHLARVWFEYKTGSSRETDKEISAPVNEIGDHRAQGLTLDSILMPRLVSGSFQRVRIERFECLVFIAAKYLARTWSGGDGSIRFTV